MIATVHLADGGQVEVTIPVNRPESYYATCNTVTRGVGYELGHKVRDDDTVIEFVAAGRKVRATWNSDYGRFGVPHEWQAPRILR